MPVANKTAARNFVSMNAWSLSGLVIVALLAAFFNPPDPGVTSGELEYVQRVVDGKTLLLGTGERVGLLGVNTP